MNFMILTASTGGGHNRAANALKDYITTHDADAQVDIIDAIEECSSTLNLAVVKGYKALVTLTPGLFGAIYKSSDKKSALSDTVNIIYQQCAKKMKPVIEKYQPDAIISCHPFAGAILGYMKQTYNYTMPLITIVTDFLPHRTYISEGINAYITASATAKDILADEYGIDRDHIFDYGHPVYEKFYEGNGLASNRKLLEVNQANVDKYSKQVEDYDRRMNEAKGDAADKDWKQIYELSVEKDTVQDGPYTELERAAESLSREKVKYVNPVKYMTPLSEEKIIFDLRGSDKTSGSCASLAFAYFVNKSGYRVLDFRGGASRRFFSYNCGDVIRRLGGTVTHDSDGFKIANDHLSQVEEGKEYYFAAGKHAAVVRKKNGKLEFLELQDRTGGWEELNDSVLKQRFKVKRTSRRGSEYSYLISGDKLTGNKELISLTGYINTASDKQKKGAGGGIK